MFRLEEYESLVTRLLKQRPLPAEPADIAELADRSDDRNRYQREGSNRTYGELQIGNAKFPVQCRVVFF